MFRLTQRPPYKPENWYWQIADKLYSSAVPGYVLLTAPAHIAWLAQGNTPTKIASETELWDVLAKQYPDGISAPQVPSLVRAAQLRLGLYQRGLLDRAETMVKQADKPTQILWEFETEMHRDHPLIVTFSQALGLDEKQTDEFFIFCSTLNVQPQ